jgi:hypothetical protein
VSQNGCRLLSNVYNQNAYFSGNGVRTSLVAAVLKGFPIQRTYETQTETLGEGALLHRPALGYKRSSGQDQLISREYKSVQSREARAKTTPDRRSRAVKSEVIPEEKSLVNVL